MDFYPDFQKDCPDLHITCILRAKISHIIELIAVQKLKRSGKEEVRIMGHPIEDLMKTAMESIKEMIDVNTIVGDASANH